MVKRLRKRPRADSSENQLRKNRGGYGRYVYLAILVALFLGVLDHTYGDRIMLRADGMVLRDRAVIGASSLVRVGRVMVHSGDEVRVGDPLFEVSSIETTQKLAELEAQDAGLAEREAAIHRQTAEVRDLTTNAARRIAETDTLVARLDALLDATNGATIDRQEQLVRALAAQHDALSEATRLASLAETLANQAKTIADARARTEAARAAVEAQYTGGQVVATAAGAVGIDVPAIGEVFRAGEPMISIQTGKSYVLAYLPNSYLFRIGLDMPVVVTSGNLSARARVDLPPESGPG